MPLPTPILDDRSWQQLRDELVRRIPVYTPEWTDHNPSDPGITLLELFAFLGENLLFRFNQVPEATRLEFLRLLQVPLRPAQPSRAMLELLAAAPTLVPIGTEARAGSTSFETEDEAKALPLSARAFAKTSSNEPTGEDAKIYTDAAVQARGLGSGEVAAYYTATMLGTDPALPGFSAVDFGATVDGVLWVALLRGKSLPATDLSPLARQVLNLGFIPDPEILTLDQVEACPGDGDAAGTDEVVWEISTPALRGDDPVYRPLIVEGDTTRGLSRQGVVRLRLPEDVTSFGVPIPGQPDLEGTGSFPPVVDDQEISASLAFWVRAYRRRAGRPLGRMLWVGANAAECVQVRTARPELLGTGTAGASQTYAVVHAPVVSGSLVVEVEEAGGWTPWTEVDDFAASGRDDRVFTVDLEAGKVRFGDGTRGRAPQIGERIRATKYRYGGGAAGNVAPKTITKVSGVVGVKSNNPRPAYGGADAEAVKDAVERIPGELRRHDRAVARDDFRELALATPGAGVGRAEVLPRFDPRTKQSPAAGIVTVVVWPAQDAQRPNAPMPDRDLLKCVCAWLDARRLVTTELYVVPPTYRKVAVSIGVKVKPGFGVEAVRAWVELVTRQYLAPLPPFGPSGQGWPLGRRVYGPELEAAALQVEGVEYVEKLRVSGWDDASQAWVEGTVTLKPWEVVELTDIAVVETQPGETPPEPGTGITPPATPQVPVPIPTIKDEC
jgi:hypothetical protein